MKNCMVCYCNCMYRCINVYRCVPRYLGIYKVIEASEIIKLTSRNMNSMHAGSRAFPFEEGSKFLGDIVTDDNLPEIR